MHDCTGPLTLLAGIHVGIARGMSRGRKPFVPTLRMMYPQLVDRLPEINEGRMLAPSGVGLGTDLNDDLFRQSGNRVRVSVL